MIHGQQDRFSQAGGPAEYLPREFQAIFLHQAVPDRLAPARQEGIGHAAADDQRVGDFDEPARRPDLVRNLCPAEHDDQLPLGTLNRPRKIVQFLPHQEPGRAFGQKTGNPLGGRVGAVGGAEGVVDVDVAQGGQPACEVRIVPGLSGVEPDVFQHQAFAVLQRFRRSLRRGTDRLPHVADRLIQEFGQPVGHRFQPQGFRHALRSPQVRHQNGPPALIQDMTQRGQRSPYARVVGDTAVGVERHIAIDANEDAPAAQCEVCEGADVHL